ncbi:hypothetical protein [Burkholderia stagnalis]|uniref:hypothetical protein n=1 Tax=Burkholderia stagnalis TaxID=1503054 RepID=UPI001627A8A0|nr:hypothetical protein [Burkholderia stagnalis]
MKSTMLVAAVLAALALVLSAGCMSQPDGGASNHAVGRYGGGGSGGGSGGGGGGY